MRPSVQLEIVGGASPKPIELSSKCCNEGDFSGMGTIDVRIPNDRGRRLAVTERKDFGPA